MNTEYTKIGVVYTNTTSSIIRCGISCGYIFVDGVQVAHNGTALVPPTSSYEFDSDGTGTTVITLELLSQQVEQQTVAWLITCGEDCFATNETAYAMSFDESERQALGFVTAPAAQPLTGEQITEHFREQVDTGALLSFAEGVRFAERHHGIGADK